MPFAACADAAVKSPPTGPAKALLILVAHHPPADHIKRLKSCLQALTPGIRYAVVVNDHVPGEPVDNLLQDADMTVIQSTNPGYGRSFNQLWQRWCNAHGIPPLVAVLNTDLSWDPGCFEALIDWLQQHPAVTAATPLLEFPNGERQYLCKRNPTLLALLSRRFIPRWIKPQRLLNYDRWYTMRDQRYDQVFSSSYLSGCCLWMRGWAVEKVGGFDPRFFLYFEDADITRRLADLGPTVNLPVATVKHHWGKGSYRNWRLTMVNLHSAWLYFRKWGLQLW